jgi:hypothetical protein
MKKFFALYFLAFTIPASICSKQTDIPSFTSLTLDRYKDYLEKGTYDGIGGDVSLLSRKPKSRYHTFKMALEHIEKKESPLIVELGTSRSYVHGGHPGCNTDDKHHWTPNQPENWDWGAGFFTRMAAECLRFSNPIIHTIDIERAHIARCKYMLADFDCVKYHICSSLDFLASCHFGRGIDLIYLDTGDMTPIEPTAILQLREVQIIVDRNLLADDGIILIDDVKNMTPRRFGETSDLGKSKYSLKYLLAHGFEVIADEYQVLLRKKQS